MIHWRCIKKGLSIPVIKRILGYCGDKVFCIFFTRIVEDIAAISALDHETVFHYEHTLTKCVYETKIVGYEQYCGPAFTVDLL